ncbi:PLP-dependent aminotransferase family protein [Streptomyces sp. NPDC091280]|uniref:MocR-like transcription factor YczR n=1 Tax=Streptomyces sp. NPDC091280 TaxID=3365984 RepID=UPI00382D2DD3
MGGNGTGRRPRAIGAHHLARSLADWRGGAGSAYGRLAESLRALIGDGRLPADARLPPERELAAALAVSRTTVTAAYGLLRATGHARSLGGSGTYTLLPQPGPARERVPDAAVIDLTTAALPAPEPWFSRALTEAAHDMASYAPTHGCFPAGLADFRKTVAGHHTRRGVPTDAGQILVTSGATGAFALLLRELVAPHDRVLVESPGHPHLLRAVEAAGARPVPVPLGDAGWDLAAWARALRETAPRLACVTADFQQPTGLLMAEESRRALVALAAATGTTLLVDETLAELSLTRPGRVPLPCAAFDPGGTVVTVGSVAKSLWAGLRVGWIRATPWLVRALVARRTGADLAPPVLEQLVAHRLLGDAGTFADVLALQRERGRARRDVLVAALRRELPGWTFRTPDGGLALWAHAGGRSGHELAAVAQRHGVRLAAGSRFGQDTRLDGFLRLPHTQPPEIIEEAVRRIAPHGRGPL